MFTGIRSLLLASLPLVVLGSPKHTMPSGSFFQLYAYGDAFGGLPLFYAGGLAYVGDPTLSNSSEAAVVSFSTNSSNQFTGNPNTTNVSTSPTWSNVTLFVPATATDDGRIGFLPNNYDQGNSTVTTSGFAFYGSTAMLIGSDGSISTAFCGMEVEEGVYQLFWNETDGTKPLTLRSVAPSNPSSKRH
ncbi:hypothetical protein BDW02DRAFT_572018 [Decorospora gaudefroyi]|uniref:Uncharacterized protein n=1 Tax=Decorospora gaudefroyi TaxID=184978 RepID=A0A6A5K8V8_9PLEO|nr:hypothetical protein BDW02DRAFT_572018 [Decorospora gaudefroyi]